MFRCFRCGMPLLEEDANRIYESDEPYCEECKEFLENKADYEAELAIEENMEEARSTGN